MNLKQAIWRSGVLLVLVGITVGLCNLFPNAAASSEAGMVMKLPGQFGVPGYVGIKLAASEEEKKWLPEDTGLLKMLYAPRTVTTLEEAFTHPDSMTATLILSGNDRRSLHRPKVCLDAQGWDIWKKEPVTLEIEGQQMEVMDYWLRKKEPQQDGTIKESRAHYIYWWVGTDTSTSSDFKRILITVLDNMFRNVNNRWGYPSVMVNVDMEKVSTPAELEVAEKTARERGLVFVRNHAPLFQKSLGADASGETEE